MSVLERKIERRITARLWLLNALARGPVIETQLRADAEGCGINYTDLCHARMGRVRDVQDLGEWAWELIDRR